MDEHTTSTNKFKQSIYRYGDIENGVYVLETELFCDESVSGTMYQVYTKSEDLSDLVKVLERLSLSFPGFGLEVVMARFKSVVAQALANRHVDVRCSDFQLLWLPPHVNLDLGTLPEDIYLKHLDESHAAEKNKMWPYRRPGSEVYLAQEIKNNFGLGLFRKSDDAMLCSALSYHFGGIFVLQTDPEHRGRGFAQIIIKHMSQELRNRKQVPFCTIDKNNTLSLTLFKKFGYEHLDDVFWFT